MLCELFHPERNFRKLVVLGPVLLKIYWWCSCAALPRKGLAAGNTQIGSSEVPMMKRSQLILVAGLLLLTACAESRIFDTNCSGNGMITNVGYCTGNLHPYAGPWSTR
jgi:hypothetical protein